MSNNLLTSVGDGVEVGSNELFFENLPSEKPGRLLLTLVEAARTLGMSEKAVRMHIERENIPFVRVGRRIFFSYKVLEAWIESQVVHPKIGRIPLTRR